VVEEGDPLPAIALAGPSGERVSLTTFRGEACVLVFLRHLG
jgi:peroxiredoxin